MSQTLPASSAQTRASDLTSTNSGSPAGHRSPNPAANSAVSTAPAAARRISSASLLGDGRAIEIEHGGRIYQLRITQLNKLILTA